MNGSTAGLVASVATVVLATFTLVSQPLTFTETDLEGFQSQRERLWNKLRIDLSQARVIPKEHFALTDSRYYRADSNSECILIAAFVRREPIWDLVVKDNEASSWLVGLILTSRSLRFDEEYLQPGTYGVWLRGVPTDQGLDARVLGLQSSTSVDLDLSHHVHVARRDMEIRFSMSSQGSGVLAIGPETVPIAIGEESQ